MVNQLLTEMDGMQSRRQVFIMAATNRPGVLCIYLNCNYINYIITIVIINAVNIISMITFCLSRYIRQGSAQAR